MAHNTTPAPTYLRRADLTNSAAKGSQPARRGLLNISRSTFYGLQDFPQPTYLSPGLPVWDEAHVLDWLERRRSAPPAALKGGYRPRKPKVATAQPVAAEEATA